MASFLNAHLVMRFGMRQLARWALSLVLGLAIIFLGIATIFAGHLPLWGLMAYLMMSFFYTGILFGNINSMVMQPLGHFAGIGAAVVGAINTLISMLLAMVIGRSYNGIELPLIIGIAVLTGISIFITRRAASE